MGPRQTLGARMNAQVHKGHSVASAEAGRPPSDLNTTTCVVLGDSVSQNAQQLWVKSKQAKVQSFFCVCTWTVFISTVQTCFVYLGNGGKVQIILNWLIYYCYLPLRMSESCVAHGQVCRSVAYCTAGCLTSLLTKCHSCPQNHGINPNHPHKFPELPLGGSTPPM